LIAFFSARFETSGLFLGNSEKGLATRCRFLARQEFVFETLFPLMLKGLLNFPDTPSSAGSYRHG